jgi:hypothetical protein
VYFAKGQTDRTLVPYTMGLQAEHDLSTAKTGWHLICSSCFGNCAHWMSSYQFHNTIVISGSFSELNGSGHGSAFTKVVPTFKAVEDSLLEEQLDTLADVSEQLDYDVPRPAARGGGGRSAYRKTTPFSFVTKKEPPSPLVFKQVQIVKKNVCLT